MTAPENPYTNLIFLAEGALNDVSEVHWHALAGDGDELIHQYLKDAIDGLEMAIQFATLEERRWRPDEEDDA